MSLSSSESLPDLILETNIPDLIQETSFSDLREYFNTRPVEFFSLFEQYVNVQEWTTVNPVLSLKAFALLDPKAQQSEESLCTLRVIFAAEVLTKDEQGVVRSIIMDAIQNNNWPFIFKLIEFGVSKNITLHRNNTLLHLACNYVMKNEALKLLELDVTCDSVNNSGDTPLHFACQNGMEEVCAVLLEMEADPSAENDQGITPLYYACSTGNEQILELCEKKFEKFAWQVMLAGTYLELGNSEKVKQILTNWKEEGDTWNYIRLALKIPHLMAFLMSHFREEVNICMDPIRRSIVDLTLDQKLEILPLMLPGDIVETIEAVDGHAIDEWLNIQVVVEEVGEGYDIRDTVEGGLIEVNDQWIQHIDWDDNEPTSHSGWLTNNLIAFLDRIPLEILSAIAMCEELSPILEPCVRVLDHDQTCVVIPHFCNEKFIGVVKELPIQGQISILKAATDDQKHAYIKEVPLPCNPLVQRWYLEDYQALIRGMEEVTDSRFMGKGEPRELFEMLLTKFEQLQLRIPHVATRELLTLRSLKQTLLLDCNKIEILHFISTTLNARILQNTSIADQMKHLSQAFESDPLYKVLKEDEKEPPIDLLCGIMGTLMTNPVTAHGHTFDKESIGKWLESSDNCPICRAEVTIDDFVSNEELLLRIQEWNG